MSVNAGLRNAERGAYRSEKLMMANEIKGSV